MPPAEFLIFQRQAIPREVGLKVGAIGISFSSRVRSVASDAASHEGSATKQDCRAAGLLVLVFFSAIEELEK